MICTGRHCAEHTDLMIKGDQYALAEESDPWLANIHERKFLLRD